MQRFYSKAYSKGLYNKIFQSWNNECIEYKVERGRQKSLAGYNHHPSQQPTLSLSAPGSASTSPPCTSFLHAVALLLPGLSFTPLNQFSCSSPSLHLLSSQDHNANNGSLQLVCGSNVVMLDLMVFHSSGFNNQSYGC